MQSAMRVVVNTQFNLITTSADVTGVTDDVFKMHVCAIFVEQVTLTGKPQIYSRATSPPILFDRRGSC